MEKGNSSNSNNDVPNYRTATRDEYWPTFHHYPANRNEPQNGEYNAMCRTCYTFFKYNIYEDITEEGHELQLKIHYQWHINGGPERERKEYEERKWREHQKNLNRRQRFDWYKDYYKEPEPIPEQQPRPYFRREPTHWTVYEKIYNFRGDHTVSCTRCAQVFDYKETILRDHYDDHIRRDKDEQRARDEETQRIIKERQQEMDREYELRKKKAREEEERRWPQVIREWKKRDEQRRIAATRMAEIEQQQADAAFWNQAAQFADNPGASNQQEPDAAFWNEAAQFADNAGASNPQEPDAAFWNEAAQFADNATGSNQQEMNEEDEQPWWDEILQHVDTADL